jgi:hypothetical protein
MRLGKRLVPVLAGILLAAAPASADDHLELTMPRRMLNDHTQTIRVEIKDSLGRIVTTGCPSWGSVSAKRVLDDVDVPLTVTQFDPHLVIPDNGIRMYFGMGSVSFTLDGGASLPPQELRITVTVGTLSVSKQVSVIASPAFRTISGTLAGADLTWGPDETIHLTGNATVPVGSTLTILPGTLIMVDTTGTLNDGTVIHVDGNVSAVGTKDRPIHFFSTLGPDAMFLTQGGSRSNANCWQGLIHTGHGSSTYTYVFLTGAGNGDVLVHPRPPVLRFDDQSGMTMEHCVLADNNGLALSSPGKGTFVVRDTLVSRNGIGGEFGNGAHLTLEDSWFVSCGRAPEELTLDGDLILLHGALSTYAIRRCVFTDGGDDAIDHDFATFSVEDSILYDVRDKMVALTDGAASFTNVLFAAPGKSGPRGNVTCDHCTITTSTPFTTPVAVTNTIVWNKSYPSCSTNMSYTDLGSAADVSCGTGNFSSDPLFRNSAACDFRPGVGNVTLTASSTGRRIGWLGFPSGVTCVSAAECDDGNVCTTDVCGDAGVCEHPAIAGCLPCSTAADCDDGNPCTVETCGGLGTCSIVPGNEGGACDDGMACTADACSGGSCVSVEDCRNGFFCDIAGACTRPVLTASFQDGGTYAGTQDTWIGEDFPSTANGARDHFRWDTDAPAREYGLLRFDDVFGSGPGQIPDGSNVLSARLAVTVFNTSSGTPGELHEAAVPWTEATTWNTYGDDPGAQPEEIGALVAPLPLSGVSDMDVTASLATWAANPSSNLGWIFVALSTDEARVYSSETTVVANRPKLTVTYNAAIPCLVPADCDDGVFCNGAEVCSGGICVAPLAPACDDGLACTADSCNEQAASCGHVGNDALCDDANACNGVETCDTVNGCVAGPPLSCDDANACNGVETCDTVNGCVAGTPLPPPAEVGGLDVSGASPTTVSWTSQGAGVVYDLAAGDLSDLAQDLGVGGAFCLADDQTGPSFVDSGPAPSPGGGYYYIIRAQDACGSGTYGFTSAGQERLPAAACP